MGDLVFTKTVMTMTSMIYIFNGAKKTNEGWIIYFTTLAAQGYAGGGSTVELEMNAGDSLQLGSNCKASVINPLKPNKAKSEKKVNKIYFDKIEKDMITLSFDFI